MAWDPNSHPKTSFSRKRRRQLIFSVDFLKVKPFDRITVLLLLLQKCLLDNKALRNKMIMEQNKNGGKGREEET